MAENYNLSLTAEDIDSRLKKIQDGGVGYTDGETIHQIEAKYLPGVCLPVVELESVIENGVALSEADSVKLDEAAAVGTPVAISCSIKDPDGVTCHGMFVSNAATTTVDEAQIDFFQTRLLVYDVTLIKQQGMLSWTCEIM